MIRAPQQGNVRHALFPLPAAAPAPADAVGALEDFKEEEVEDTSSDDEGDLDVTEFSFKTKQQQQEVIQTAAGANRRRNLAPGLLGTEDRGNLLVQARAGPPIFHERSRSCRNRQHPVFEWARGLAGALGLTGQDDKFVEFCDASESEDELPPPPPPQQPQGGQPGGGGGQGGPPPPPRKRRRRHLERAVLSASAEVATEYVRDAIVTYLDSVLRIPFDRLPRSVQEQFVTAESMVHYTLQTKRWKAKLLYAVAQRINLTTNASGQHLFLDRHNDRVAEALRGAVKSIAMAAKKVKS